MNVVFLMLTRLVLALARVCSSRILLSAIARMVRKLCMAGYLFSCVVPEVGAWYVGAVFPSSLLPSIVTTRPRD